MGSLGNFCVRHKETTPRDYSEFAEARLSLRWYKDIDQWGCGSYKDMGSGELGFADIPTWHSIRV